MGRDRGRAGGVVEFDHGHNSDDIAFASLPGA